MLSWKRSILRATCICCYEMGKCYTKLVNEMENEIEKEEGEGKWRRSRGREVPGRRS